MNQMAGAAPARPSAARPPKSLQPKSLWRRLSSPVRTPRGGFSPLKAFVFALLFVPGLVLAWHYATQQLGARPVLALVHGTGEWAVRLLLITLALTPAARLLNWPQMALIRRMIGVAAAAYALIHLTLYCAQQNFHLLHVAAEIIHRFYLTIGFAALCGLVALAATSTDASVRRLGKRWKRLHRLIYPIAVLALLHYFLQAKAQVFPAVVLAGLFVWLMAWRALPPPARVNPWTPLLLGILATLATAGIEVAWYGLATGVNIHRVFVANFRFVHWRPSAYVALWSLAAAAVIAARRLIPPTSGTAPRAAPAGPPAPAS
jgi:sulfoxide reductase heme-binding subunit YedZ